MKITSSLNVPTTLEQVKKEFTRLQDDSFGKTSEALEFLHSLEQKLSVEKIKSSEYADQYREIIARLRINLFPYFINEKVNNFLKKYFVQSVRLDMKDEVSFYRNLSAYISHFHINKKVRNEILEKIRKTISQSSDLLGKEKILVNGQKKEPLFKNWLQDYIVSLGTGRHTTEMIRQYLRESENVKKISREDKLVLERCLRYYELLKIKYTEFGSIANMSEENFGFNVDEIGRINQDIFNLNVPYYEYLPEDEREGAKRRDIKRAKAEKEEIKESSFQGVNKQKTIDELSKMEIPEVKYEESPAIKSEREPVVTPKPIIKPAPKAVKPIPVPKKIKPQVEKIQKVIKTGPTKEELEQKRLQEQLEKAKKEKIVERKEEIAKRKVVEKQPEKLKELLSPGDIKRVEIDFFRGLGKSDDERLKNFETRIEDLKKKDSPDVLKKYWQESSLYKLYLEIGRKSMTSDLSVAEVGKGLFNEGRPYLTEREFEMIAEISSKF